MKLSIHKRVQKVRNTMNFTQPKFADSIFISKGYLAQIEGRTKEVNERIAYLICSRFGIDEIWLKTGKGEMFVSDENNINPELAKLFNGLNTHFQAQALNQLRILVDLQKTLKIK